jgi:hypothetical protein
MVKHKQKIKPNEIDQPKIKIGRHLTVYTYPDGKVELKWDDVALLQEIREAIALHEYKQTLQGK